MVPVPVTGAAVEKALALVLELVVAQVLFAAAVAAVVAAVRGPDAQALACSYFLLPDDIRA